MARTAQNDRWDSVDAVRVVDFTWEGLGVKQSRSQNRHFDRKTKIFMKKNHFFIEIFSNVLKTILLHDTDTELRMIAGNSPLNKLFQIQKIKNDQNLANFDYFDR